MWQFYVLLCPKKRLTTWGFFTYFKVSSGFKVYYLTLDLRPLDVIVVFVNKLKVLWTFLNFKKIMKRRQFLSVNLPSTDTIVSHSKSPGTLVCNGIRNYIDVNHTLRLKVPQILPNLPHYTSYWVWRTQLIVVLLKSI